MAGEAADITRAKEVFQAPSKEQAKIEVAHLQTLYGCFPDPISAIVSPNVVMFSHFHETMYPRQLINNFGRSLALVYVKHPEKLICLPQDADETKQSFICVNLFQLKAYPLEAFKPAFVFGTPVKILRAHNVRRYVMKILNSLQLSNDGQQELVLRYRHPERGGYCDVVFRFQCFALHSDTYLNLDIWKEAFGLALGQLWLRPLPAFPDINKGVSWSLLVRNWFQSGCGNCQTALTTNFVDAEVSNHGLRSCFPVHSINKAGLNFQILYVFLGPATLPLSNDAPKADGDRTAVIPNA
ncbi:hypothetical protein TcWFU_001007 [Taenia crassiceps]|uniref:Uncharacterized protein n=1 Tax=Taenia crassiceps TaxID=6207 RepID=A0ABR4QFV1_9CEST